MIKLDKINVTLGKKQILDSFNAEIEAGKITAIIGRNGSGKTTVLRTVCGLLTYTGNIFVDGKDRRNYSRKELAKKICLMPQSLTTAHIRVRELVSFGRFSHLNSFGFLSDNDRQSVDRALIDSDSVSLADKYADEISGGELRKVFFAMMLCTDADVFLLDEPTANLDASHKRALLSMLESLCRKKGKTVAIVLHDVNDALAFADRIVALDHGKCVFSGDRNDAINEKIPQRFFGLSPLVSEDEHGKRIILYR